MKCSHKNSYACRTKELKKEMKKKKASRVTYFATKVNVKIKINDILGFLVDKSCKIVFLFVSLSHVESHNSVRNQR
jgi:hypothetical protein